MLFVNFLINSWKEVQIHNEGRIPDVRSTKLKGQPAGIKLG